MSFCHEGVLQKVLDLGFSHSVDPPPLHFPSIYDGCLISLPIRLIFAELVMCSNADILPGVLEGST